MDFWPVEMMSRSFRSYWVVRKKKRSPKRRLRFRPSEGVGSTWSCGSTAQLHPESRETRTHTS